MPSLPVLTLCVLTFKRAHYGLLGLMGLLDNLRYDGEIRYLVSDGGSAAWEIAMYEHVLRNVPHSIIQSEGFPAMFAACAEHDGSVWLSALDDFVLDARMDVTPDVEFLRDNPDVGHIRMGRMAYWDVPAQTVYAQLRGKVGANYWVVDKERSTAPYLWTLGFGITHRRMWDAYAPITQTAPHMVGETELSMNDAFRTKSGPTVASPTRLWADANMAIPLREAVRHLGFVRTDEYTHAAGEGESERWGQV